MTPYMAGILVPLVFTLVIRNSKKKEKRRSLPLDGENQRGVPVDVAGEAGYAIRNYRFESPVESWWQDITTLAELFQQSCTQHHDKSILGTRKLVSREVETSGDGRTFEKVHLGEYEWLSYGQVFEVVCNFSSGLAQLGHKREERVAIFADTCDKWFISLQGCFRRNVTMVTIYASLGEEALCYSLNETEVTTVICGRKELKKLEDIGGQLDTVKRIICMDDEFPSETSLVTGSNSWTLASFSDVEILGRQNPIDPELPLAADVAVIMYTSGSTGLPKGVMMTHGNVLATISAVMTIVPNLGSKDVYLAYLPLAHILELVAENVIAAIGGSIGYGTPLTLTDTSSKIKWGTKGDASMLSPTLMTAVPAILDRVQGGVRKKVDTTGGFSKRLFDLAYSRRLSAINGSWFGAWGIEKLLWNFLVFRKIRAILGGRIRFILSGGAPLSGDTQRFINICIGAPIGQGYGLTETCAGGTFSEYDDTSVGRVGAPLPCSFVKKDHRTFQISKMEAMHGNPGATCRLIKLWLSYDNYMVQVKLKSGNPGAIVEKLKDSNVILGSILIDWAEGGYLTTDSPKPRGEIVVGGPNVTLGYFKNEEKTKEVYKVDERGIRWFFTGDIGQFHADGCLEIIDRKKDIVKLQHGEYVSLGKVEAALVVSPFIDNIMMHADPFHSYCVALVVPSQASLEDWASRNEIKYDTFSKLCDKEQVLKEVSGSIIKAAKAARLQKFEIPSKIKLISEAWTPESGLVTAALKIKREMIRKTFSEDLNKLYST